MKVTPYLNSLKSVLVFIAASAILTASLATSIAQNVTMSGNFVTVSGGTLPTGSELSGQVVATFQIGNYEVTWGEWKSVRDWAVTNNKGYDLAGVGDTYPSGSADNLPVIKVNWHDAVKWCNAKSEKEGMTPVYTADGTTYKTGDKTPTVSASANGYRLPSEKEWEWAARGGGSSQGYTYSGSNTALDVAWTSENSSGTKAVGTKAANELGIYDMSGNVWEWCEDLQTEVDESYSRNSAGQWITHQRYHYWQQYRGGSWADSMFPWEIAAGGEVMDFGYHANVSRVDRYYLLDWSDGLNNRHDIIGFRLARNLPPVITPVITSQSTGNGEIGAPFTYQITASHSPTSYTASGLPSGLTVNATTGLISGSPTLLGNFSVNLRATNSSGTGNAALALVIAQRITVTSNATAPATQGMPFRYQITASNPPHISYAVFRGLPAGTTWNATTGLIAGTPTVSGNFLISVTANNTFSSSAAKWVTIQVAPAPMPVIASFNTIGNVAFQAYNTQPAPVLAVTANNPGNNPLTYQWFKEGVAIAGATGTTYNLGAASAATAGYYHVVLKNAANQTLSSPKLAFKLLPATTFAISGPVNQSFSAGANATFLVSSLGGLPPGNATVAYQWYRNGVSISGATSSNYTVPGGMSSATAGSYAVDVTTSLNGTPIGTVRSTSWAFTPQDTGILVYTLSGSALRTIGANETIGTLTGYVVVDRANNNAAIIQTHGLSFGRRNSLEMRPDIAVASTGPVLGSRTVLAGSLNNGDTPVDHDMVWVTGKDAEVVVAATTTSPILPQVRLFAPTSMTGFMCILARIPASVEIEHYGVTLSLNTTLTAASYRNGQNLTQAIAAVRAAAATAGFPNAETNP